MIAEDKPLSRCTCSAIRMMSRHVSQIYDRALASSGLRSGQYALLAALSRVGPLGVQDLAEHLILDRTTVARNLRPLERDGLVRIEVDPEDRRGRLLTITDAGWRLLQTAEPLWLTAQERLETRFGTEPTWELHSKLASLLALDLSR